MRPRRPAALPRFLLIGAEKAGTTWLHAVLSEHREIFLPDVKELHYFNRFDSNLLVRDRQSRLGLEWYANQFVNRGEARTWGEATPLYLSDPCAPVRIRNALPEVKILISLRDPVDRALSQARMAGAKGHIRGDLCSRAHDARVFDRSLYARQIANWLRLYPREQIHVAYFEDLLASPRNELAKIGRFLGVAGDGFTILGTRNSAASYRSAAFYRGSIRLASTLRSNTVTAPVAALLKASGFYAAVKALNRRQSRESALPPGLVAELTEKYVAEVDALRALLPAAPPPWPRFSDAAA